MRISSLSVGLLVITSLWDAVEGVRGGGGRNRHLRHSGGSLKEGQGQQQQLNHRYLQYSQNNQQQQHRLLKKKKDKCKPKKYVGVEPPPVKLTLYFDSDDIYPDSEQILVKFISEDGIIVNGILPSPLDGKHVYDLPYEFQCGLQSLTMYSKTNQNGAHIFAAGYKIENPDDEDEDEDDEMDDVDDGEDGGDEKGDIELDIPPIKGDYEQPPIKIDVEKGDPYVDGGGGKIEYLPKVDIGVQGKPDSEFDDGEDDGDDDEDYEDVYWWDLTTYTPSGYPNSKSIWLNRADGSAYVAPFEFINDPVGHVWTFTAHGIYMGCL